MVTGKQHKFNVLKFKILAELFKAAPGALTAQELAEKIESHKSKCYRHWLQSLSADERFGPISST